MYEVKDGKGYGYIYLPKEYIGTNVAVVFKVKENDDVGALFGEEYYNEKYFVGEYGGIPFSTPDRKTEYWSYYNFEGEWTGAQYIMEAINEVFNPENMLDAGCGRGTFCAYGEDVGIKSLGIDFSEWAIEHPYPRAQGIIQLGDVRDIQFPDNSFDLVFASDICEHIFVDDIDKVISEFQRVSRKWVFYNIGGIVGEDEEPFGLKKGEKPPCKWQATAVAGHVNIRPCEGYWKKKVVNDKWQLRVDLVKKFRILVPKEVLTNWVCIIITEKKGAVI